MGESEIPTGLISGIVVSFVFDSCANNCSFFFVCLFFDLSVWSIFIEQ